MKKIFFLLFLIVLCKEQINGRIYSLEKDTVYTFQRIDIINKELNFYLEEFICPFVKNSGYDSEISILYINSITPDLLCITYFPLWLQNLSKDEIKYLYISKSCTIPILISNQIPKNYYSITPKNVRFYHKIWIDSMCLFEGDNECRWWFEINGNNLVFKEFEHWGSDWALRFDEWPLLQPDRRIKKLNLEADVPREIKSMVKTYPAPNSPRIPLIPTRKMK